MTLVEVLVSLSLASVVLTAALGLLVRAQQVRDAAVREARRNRLVDRLLELVREDLAQAVEVDAEGRSFSLILEPAQDNSWTLQVMTHSRLAGFADVSAVLRRVAYTFNAAEHVLRRDETIATEPGSEEDQESVLAIEVETISLSVSDEQAWYDAWPSDERRSGLPTAVRVVVIGGEAGAEKAERQAVVWIPCGEVLK